MPRQGREVPWRMLMDYARDRPMLLSEPIVDTVLQFSQRGSAAASWSE
jgi:hypothetical protein